MVLDVDSIYTCPLKRELLSDSSYSFCAGTQQNESDRYSAISREAGTLVFHLTPPFD